MAVTSTGAYVQHQGGPYGSVQAAGPHAVHQVNVVSTTVWEGTTWLNSCPCWLACFAPLCCLTWHWHITNKRIDVTHGCCRGKIDAVDLRRVIDIHFGANCIEMCIRRGTVTIRSDDPETPILKINTWGARKIFKDLREAWSNSRLATAVNVDG